MYSFKSVVKFENNYFEDRDVVVVTTNDETVIVGAIIIESYGGSITSNNVLVLDISEKYQEKRTFINSKEIKNIQKVN